MLSILRIKWFVNYSTYFTDHLIHKAPSDFRQRFLPSPATLDHKKLSFTMLTSTVDALTSSTTVALRESFLAAPPQATSATSSTKKKKRHKEDAQGMKKKTPKEWGRSKKKNQEEEAGRRRGDPKEEEAEVQTRGERGFIFLKKISEGHYGLFTAIAGCT